MTVAIIVLIAICIALIIALSKKTKIDKEIITENQKQIQINEQLKQEQQELVLDKEVIRKEILANEQQNYRLNQTLSSLRNDISNTIEQNKEISNKAFEEYRKTLEIAYNDYECHFDIEMLSLHNQIQETTQELNKLKATRAAAYEALMKEQEIKENKDNYRLLPSQADLTDARRLEIVKRELNKPRILSMLIWQTYWQPIAKKQFPQILQDKTKCGIYKITNIITDECYIGQSVDIYKRWNDHCKCGLGIDTPPGNKLYKSIQEYGLENFTFELLTTCNQTELNEKERYFIELYQADTFGFNSQGGNK